MSDPVRVGVAGFGLGGAVFHAPLAGAVDGLEVAAIMTRSPERVASARAAYPAARVVGEIDQLLDGIDLLVVTTPNRSHVPIGSRGWSAGWPSSSTSRSRRARPTAAGSWRRAAA